MAVLSFLAPLGVTVHWPRGLEIDPLLGFGLLALIALCLRSAIPGQQARRFVLANPPKWYELKLIKQIRFLFNGIDELDKARHLAHGSPFSLLTNSREIIVLPPSYAEVLATEDRLSFARYFADVCVAGCAQPKPG
jgi:hypothetical protein